MNAMSRFNPQPPHGLDQASQGRPGRIPQKQDQNAVNTSRGDTAIPAHISPKLTAQCQNGEYVNLYELLPHDPLPCNEMVAVQNTDGTVSFQQRKVKKSIDNFDNWLNAWSVFEQLVVISKPTMYMYSKLAQYRQFIHRCDRKFLWHAVSTYDTRFRAKLSETKSFMYDTVDNMLYVSILISNPRRCQTVFPV